MKCPRCKNICEEEDALYCLICGKKLRRDDAFDGEFQEEFRFDEEIEAENRAREEREALLKKERIKTVLILGSLCLLVVAVCALFFFLLHPVDTTVPQEDPDTASATDEQEETSIEAFIQALFVASCQSYDLDTILAGVPSELSNHLLQELLAEYNCNSKEELKTAFAELREKSALTVTDLSVTVSDALTEEELSAELDAVYRRTGITLPAPSAAYVADVICFAKQEDELLPIVSSYLVFEYENQYSAIKQIS